MSHSSRAQGVHSDYALHTLGWKAFQDLCVAVSAEVLQRPVQTFLPSKDGGRDGAFIGAWPGGDDTPNAKSTIQCKFASIADKKLTLRDLSNELTKVKNLAQRDLANDYIIITNAGVSGVSEEKISSTFKAAGVQQCRVFGRDWLTNEIRTRPRLRMMVPRLYGLGDLSQIIDERAYAQARRILSSMGDDLACFVTTQAHRQSVNALNRHRFVLLLGDPASGKSTIGASLAIGALDDGAVGTIKVTSPEMFEQHWNPDEPTQFFWIDDAFGATQTQAGLIDGWNPRLKMLRAAIRSGARVLMTSRSYIWKSAQSKLKCSEFPLLENSQVIIDVHNLSKTERAQILYNHIKHGDQTLAARTTLKRYLPTVATNDAFLPETARRLGSTFFTRELRFNDRSIKDFVERPVNFLVEVLGGLDDGARAAVALIFLHGSTGVPSPVPPSPELDRVCHLTGVSAATVTQSLETLRGTLSLLIDSEDGLRWTFKHPTIADAYAMLVRQSPEMVEIYVRGAKRERLLNEVVCGNVQIPGASVRIPRALYPLLLTRITEGAQGDYLTLSFLSYRANKHFLAAYADAAPAIFDCADDISENLSWSREVAVLANFSRNGLLPKEVRLRSVKRIAHATIEYADGAIFSDANVRELLTDEEFDALATKFEIEVVGQYTPDPLTWGSGVFSTDQPGHFRSLREGLESFLEYASHKEEITNEIEEAIEILNVHIADLEQEYDDPPWEAGETAPPMPEPEITTIFDDIDA